MRPRRGVVIFDAYPHAYGGAQRTDHLLARDLPGRGWPVSTIVPGPGRFPDRLTADGLPVVVVGAPGPLQRVGGTTTRAGPGAGAGPGRPRGRAEPP
ncbi:MAG: hypothetical protein ACT4PW_02465, partial [Acidimicrobiia bacterium]